MCVSWEGGCSGSNFFAPSPPPQSLCQVLDASVSMGSRVLETQLDSLLLVLHQQVHQCVRAHATHFKCYNPGYTTSGDAYCKGPGRIESPQDITKYLQSNHSLFISTVCCFLLGPAYDYCQHVLILTSCDSGLQHQLTAGTLTVHKLWSWNTLSSHFQELLMWLQMSSFAAFSQTAPVAAACHAVMRCYILLRFLWIAFSCFDCFSSIFTHI